MTFGRDAAAERRRLIVWLVAIVAFATVPAWAGRANMRLLSEFFYYLTLAQMWNLLVGYAGILSAGQQAYVGAGGYLVFALAIFSGISPFIAIPIAGLLTALLAIPAGFVIFRLEGAYLAIGSWVVAEVFRLAFSQVTALGAGSGMSLPTTIVSSMAADAAQRDLILYSIGLALAALSVGLVYWILRSPYGLALTSIRDDETAAESLGVQTYRTKFIIYLIVAFVTGMVGAFIFIQKINITPNAAFDINNWLVFVIFIIVIGGLGTLEGPFIGTFIFFLVREVAEDWGSWYLVALGLVAIVVVLRMPKGVWGYLSNRFGWRLFPVQRHVQPVLPPTHSDGRKVEV